MSVTRDYRVAPEWQATFDYDGLGLSLRAVPDVARRVKPLIAGFRYFVVGRVVRGIDIRGSEPAWVRAEVLLQFELEEIIIARGPERCIVARIPLTSVSHKAEPTLFEQSDSLTNEP